MCYDDVGEGYLVPPTHGLGGRYPVPDPVQVDPDIGAAMLRAFALLGPGGWSSVRKLCHRALAHLAQTGSCAFVNAVTD